MSQSPVHVGAPWDSRAADHLSRVVDTYEVHVATGQAYADKTVQAMRQIVEMHAAGMLAKQETMELMHRLDTTVHFNDRLSQLWHEASRQQALDMINTVHKLLHLGSRRVAFEMDRKLPPLPPERPTGLIARLLLGTEDDSQ